MPTARKEIDMKKTYKVKVIHGDGYFFKEDHGFYLVECTNGIIDGFHVFTNANHTGHVCNITRAEARQIFEV